MLPTSTSRPSIREKPLWSASTALPAPAASPLAQPLRAVDETTERGQIERVRALRARRDPLRWRAAVDRVTEHARSTGNLMPAILEAVESYATVGEIAESMRTVFGEYRHGDPKNLFRA